MKKKVEKPILRKVKGGKNIIKVIENFVKKNGVDPKEAQQFKNDEAGMWIFTTNQGIHLELACMAPPEGVEAPLDYLVSLTVPLIRVPIAESLKVLATALEIASNLVYSKLILSEDVLLVNLVITDPTITVDDLEEWTEILSVESEALKEDLLAELGWEEVGEEGFELDTANGDGFAFEEEDDEEE
ncbi:MAG: hypothetical protein D6780_04130 [Candidatus Dadabacteria bacterium]|nr:MAG: hypothetical protein D6780_04130 [Candidatus Dadabacteria bacterium]